MLVAVIVFSISLLALVPLMTTAVSIDRENYLNVRARSMAADLMDTLMANAVPPFGNPSSETDGGVVITRAWNIVPDPDPNVNLDTITVTVGYDYKGQQKILTLTSQRPR